MKRNIEKTLPRNAGQWKCALFLDGRRSWTLQCDIAAQRVRGHLGAATAVHEVQFLAGAIFAGALRFRAEVVVNVAAERVEVEACVRCSGECHPSPASPRDQVR